MRRLLSLYRANWQSWYLSGHPLLYLSICSCISPVSLSLFVLLFDYSLWLGRTFHCLQAPLCDTVAFEKHFELWIFFIFIFSICFNFTIYTIDILRLLFVILYFILKTDRFVVKVDKNPVTSAHLVFESPIRFLSTWHICNKSVI